MKLRIQAQHLQPGDIVGSGEVVQQVTVNSIHWSSKQVQIKLNPRIAYWGKYTMINVERVEKLEGAEAIRLHQTLNKLGFDKPNKQQQEASNDAQYWWRNKDDQTTAN